MERNNMPNPKKPMPVGSRYYLIEETGVLKVVNGALAFSLVENGEWFPNQYAMSLFYDSMKDYREITEEEVQKIIWERKK
jgi:hypothetical protein